MAADSDAFSRRMFLVSLLFLALVVSFSYGVAVWHSRIWPYEHLAVLSDHARNFVNYGVWAPRNLVVPAPAQASRERVVLHDPAAMMPGYRAILGWDFEADQHAVWLLDDQGDEVHSWLFRYSALDPDGGATGAGKTHALKVLDDGSIVLTIEDLLLARLDACGKAVWVNTGGYHHSLEEAGDGTLWTWRGEEHHFSHYQYMQNLDPWTGEIIQELSLIDDFIEKSPDAMAIFSLPQDYPFKRAGEADMPDIFHTNDVEVLGSGMAGKFPGFRAGDLLVSLKTINLVAVLDPVDRVVKWWMQGPWIGQHDPDFDIDGRISVFNNNMGRKNSNIVFVDPKTNEISFSREQGGAEFYTLDMGKHQRLSNGNILITVPREGRVIETTPSGELAFEFNNIFSERTNGTVANAIWLPPEYFKTFPACTGK